MDEREREIVMAEGSVLGHMVNPVDVQKQQYRCSMATLNSRAESIGE